MNPKDIQYGLVVVDPLQEGENKDVLHFVGYFEEPDKSDINNLRDELTNDPEFELQERIGELDIIRASEETVEFFRNLIIENENEIS